MDGPFRRQDKVLSVGKTPTSNRFFSPTQAECTALMMRRRFYMLIYCIALQKAIFRGDGRTLVVL
jgi:hypothetical protein